MERCPRKQAFDHSESMKVMTRPRFVLGEKVYAQRDISSLIALVRSLTDATANKA